MCLPNNKESFTVPRRGSAELPGLPVLVVQHDSSSSGTRCGAIYSTGAGRVCQLLPVRCTRTNQAASVLAS
jgi:hypothetical protein